MPVKSVRVDLEKGLVVALDKDDKIAIHRTLRPPFRIRTESPHEVILARAGGRRFLEFLFPKEYECSVSESEVVCREVKV